MTQKTTSQKLDEIVVGIEEGATLHHYAATAAARELVTNWIAALTAGAALRDLTADIDVVVELLREFKSAAERLSKETDHGA